MNCFAVVIAAAFRIWSVDPYGIDPYLPDAPPKGGVVTSTLSCSAAKGEIETISFSVEPERDLKMLDFIPSDLIGPDGAVIPASCADFALVKCWYRAGYRWFTSWSGAVDKPELINDLVIHDNDLIRVVESTNMNERTILLRIDYPEGPAYVDMRRHGSKKFFFHDLHPVKDAKKFVPFDLKKGRFQQYWFTWKIPNDARPGQYRGILDVRESGNPLMKIPVELEVYPFALPEARTHYDTSKPFILSMMGTPSLEQMVKRSKNLAVSEEKCRNIYRSLAEHNAHQPSGPGTFRQNSTDDLSVRSLILMLQAGMKCDLIINGSSYEGKWHGTFSLPPDEEKKLLEQSLAKYNAMLDVQAAVLDKYLGHRNCYFSGQDECGTNRHRHDYCFFAELHKRGFQAWSDYGNPYDISWSIGMNAAPASARYTTSWEWHKGGALCVSYAGTFTGPSCPDIWRRTKGLRYYYADFDGLDEHSFYFDSGNHWNDFTNRGPYTQMQIVYLTYDGLIPTLAWEGLREGMDDIRYLSLLRLRAESAMKSRNRNVREMGRDNIIWMDSQDPEAIIDLRTFRCEVARRICELVAVIGEEPTEKPMQIPALPPSTYGVTIPKNADKMQIAEEYTKNNRYDLAIPLLDEIATDTSNSVDARIEATTKEAQLLSEILHREAAIKVIDRILSEPTIGTKRKARLLLLKAGLMATEKVYEEEFSADQLNAAAKILEEALHMQGPSPKERYEAAIRLALAYIASNEPELAFRFAEARLGDLHLEGQQKCDFYVVQAKACVELKDWDSAAKAFQSANSCGNCKTRDLLQLEGMVAEHRKDWKTALRCYTEEVKTYDKVEQQSFINACNAKIRRVSANLVQTANKAEVYSFEETDFSLDVKLDE